MHVNVHPFLQDFTLNERMRNLSPIHVTQTEKQHTFTRKIAEQEFTEGQMG